LAARSDFGTSQWRELFETLERQQTEFLSREAQFRSPEYHWPWDPLHNWSRAWEYPYTYYHLKEFRRLWVASRRPLALDFGSGVTFFPFTVARLGYEIVCFDNDPVCHHDLERAIAVTEHHPGHVRSCLSADGRVPLPDGSVDVVYCISVLEHIVEFEKAIAEISRVLKSDGLFLLTFDLDLRGDQELGVLEHERLIKVLSEHFDCAFPEKTVHPVDILKTVDGPYGLKPLTGFRKWAFMAKQDWIKPFFGKKPHKLIPYFLTVQAFALQRRRAHRLHL
jgi:SAM-dependent methyltransferase